MSLENPTIFEKAMQYKRYIGIGAAAVVALGLLLWLVAYQESCSLRNRQEKAKNAVNATVEELKNVNANIAVEKQKEQELLGNLKRDTKDYLDAINATDASREAVNASIERMNQAANSNRNVNARDVEEAMKGL